MYSANRFSGQGEGANLYTSSVVALDADTGKLKWYYQEIPKDVWDYDSAYECVLIDRDGARRDAQAAGAYQQERVRVGARPHQRKIHRRVIRLSTITPGSPA